MQEASPVEDQVRIRCRLSSKKETNRFRNPRTRQQARYTTVDPIHQRTLTNVCKIMVLPMPIGDDGVFSEDGVGFDDYGSFELTSGTELTPWTLKKIWLMMLMSLGQKDTGTPALRKKPFLAKTRWADFDKYLYPFKGRRNVDNLNKDAFVSTSINGTVVFDYDVARHYHFLDTRTRHLPCTPVPKPGKDPLPVSGIELEAPNATEKDKTVRRLKYHVMLQPCRRKAYPDELAGFLCWIFIEDPNFNMDGARCKFINAVQDHRERLESRTGKFPVRSAVSQDIKNSVTAMRLDDPEMLTTTHKDWMQWCDMYDLSVKLLEGDRAASLGVDNDTIVETMRVEEAGDPTKYVEQQLLRNYVDELDEPTSDSSSSFFTVFTPDKAFLLAKKYGMDMDNAPTYVDIGRPMGDDKTMTVILGPKRYQHPTEEPVSLTINPYLHAFDNQYVMTPEYFYWADTSTKSRMTGSGLKYNAFPWSNNDTNPVYKQVVLKLPERHAHRLNNGNAALIRNVNCGSESVSLSDVSSTLRARPSKKRSRESASRESASRESASSETDRPDVVATSVPAPPVLYSSSDDVDMGDDNNASVIVASEAEIAAESALDLRVKMARINSFVPTDAVQGMAASRGMNPRNLNIGGCKLFQDPQTDPSEENDYVNFTYSKTAAMDDVHKVIEIHENWKSSIHQYAEVANMESQPPESDADVERWVNERKASVVGDSIVYHPTEFVQSYNDALAAFEKSAVEHLFRCFKTKDKSVLTTSVHHLVNYYLRNVHNNVDRSLFRKLHCAQTDFDASLFSAYVKKKSIDLRYVCEIISNFKEFHVIYFGVLDVYRVGNDTHFNYLGSGEGGVGKSFLLELLSILLAEGTVQRYYLGSDKSEYTDLSKSDSIITSDELPPGMAGRQAGNNDKHGHTLDAIVNATKTAMSTGMSVYEVFEFIETDDGEVHRTSRKIVTPCVSCRIVVTNNKVILDKALIDRCHKATFVTRKDADADDVDPNEEDVYGIDPVGKQHPKDYYKHLTVIDMKTQMKTSDDSEFKLVKLGYSVFQALHMIVEKMIGTGALPKIDVSLGNLVFNVVSKYIKARTNINIAMRSHERISNEMRTMIITDAVNNLYFSCCRDRDVINEKTLMCLKPYLFCQFHHAFFALTLLMDQMFDPYFNIVLFAAINECARFPVKRWVNRRIEKRTIDRSARAATAAARVAHNAAAAAAAAAGTTTGIAVVPTPAPQAVVQIDVDADVDVDTDVDMDVEPVQTLAGAVVDGGNQNLEPELVCDILKDIYTDDYSNNGHATIRWRTSDSDKGPTRGGNKDDQPALIDLNYVWIHVAEESMLYSLLSDNMPFKLGSSDVSGHIAYARGASIKVSGAPRPITDAALMDANFTGKIPCYEDKHTFAVLEKVQSSGGKGYDWYFCVHVLTDLNNGESLILDALKTVTYKGFRPRPSLLTGFVESYEGATLRSVAMNPNPNVECFRARNAAYREEWVRKQMVFNQVLESQDGPNPITLLEAIKRQDPIYKNKSIDIYKDLDDWAAEEWCKKNGIPTVWVRKTRREDINLPADPSLPAEIVTTQTNFKATDLELKWKFLMSDGRYELRDLPTEHAQRVRNLYWIKNDGFTNIRSVTEQAFKEGQTEWSDLDRDFDIVLFPEY